MRGDEKLPRDWRDQRMVVPQQGQQVVFEPNPITGVVASAPFTFLTLARAEDRKIQNWQVTLSPVFRRLVGPVEQGMPGLATPPTTATGVPRLRMTWGAGGVSFRIDMAYPTMGASFSVSGDNIQLEVAATDGVTVFTADNAPVVQGWVKPDAKPSAPQPLMDEVSFDAPFFTAGIQAFQRALWVYASDIAATVAVVFTGPSGTITLRINANQFPARIPVPSGMTSVTVTPTAGTVAGAAELVFT